MSMFKRINEISDNKKVRTAWFSAVCVIFLIVIIIPSLFVLVKLFTEWGLVQEVMNNEAMMTNIKGAVWNSFSIAGIVTIIDVIVGIPMAWILVRKQFRGKKYLDTLMDMPLVFPTAVLGLSVAVFWGVPAEGLEISGLGIVISPYILIILLHLIFTYPYMVRALSAILEQMEPNYEVAGRTLGASKFTAIRTITLPLFRSGLVTGIILCFARSLSETGGTYIALETLGMSDTFFTGPTFIAFLKDSPGDPTGAMILISVFMIVLALVLLVLVNVIMKRAKIPVRKVWPQFGRLISKGLVPKLKDFFSILFLVIIILIPSFFIFMYLTQPVIDLDYSGFFKALGLSFSIAGIAVVVDVILGIPIAMYVTRNKNTMLGKILDILVTVPLIVPTTVLGLSLGMFWTGVFGDGFFGVVMVILGHISFTFPLVVRNIIGSLEEVDPSHEEVAMTLGAKPFQSFAKVLFPVIKISIIAGAILAFTRSLGETGATLAISDTVVTIPVFLVRLVKEDSFAEAAMLSMILVAICFAIMFLLRVVVNRGGRNA